MHPPDLSATTFCAALCPLCGQPNACALPNPEQAAADCASVPGALACWCAQQPFAPDWLARLPPAAHGRACICRACAQAAARP